MHGNVRARSRQRGRSDQAREGSVRSSRPGGEPRARGAPVVAVGWVGGPRGVTCERTPAVVVGEAAGKGEEAASADARTQSWEGREGRGGRSHEKTRRAGSQGLVRRGENVGCHLQNDGTLSTGLGLGLMRAGSCFERVFLLFGAGAEGHRRTRSGNKAADAVCAGVPVPGHFFQLLATS